MPTLALLVLAKDEAANIGPCLDSAIGVDEIIVIDDHSQDETRALAEARGARVITHPLESFADQLNFAHDQAQSDWVFFLDADERLSTELMAAIRRHLGENPGRPGQVKRHNRAFGRHLCFGPLKPDWVPRLFPRGTIKWSGLVHQFPIFTPAAARLGGHLIHYTYRDWNHYFKKMDRYAALWAENAHQRGKKVSQPEIWARLAWNWFKMIFLNLGILGGPVTWALCYFNGAYTLSKYLLLNELQQRPHRENGE